MVRKTGLMLCLLLCLCVSLPASGSESEGHQSTGKKIAVWLQEKGVPEEAVIGMISMLPIVELRGAVPVGHILAETGQMEPAAKLKASLWVYLMAVIGNMIPIPFILLLLGPVSKFLMRWKCWENFFEWLFARTRRKSASIEKYEALGLTLFVAIPLPVTGGWTGAMAAFLMGTRFPQALGCILLGVMTAGVIMTVLSLMGWVGACIAGAVLLALAAGTVLKTVKPKGKNHDR